MASEILAPPAESIADLSNRFDQLAARIRRVALLRGLGRLALVAAVLCGLGLLADWLWPLPAALRTGWLFVMLAALGYAGWLWVIRPVFREFTIAELAAIVETEYPELGERLTSAVELTDPNIPEEHKGSALMREWLEAETISSTTHIDFKKSVSTEEATRSAWSGGLAVGLLLVPFLLMSSGYRSLWARMLQPWGSHESPAELYFHVPNGDRVVARGEDFTVLAMPPEDVASEDLPEAVELVWTTEAGDTIRRAMEYHEKQNGFQATIPHVFENFQYIIEAKRKRSDRHNVLVVDRPEITAFVMQITPPNYTGQPRRSADGAVGDVLAFERSRIEAVLEFNKPLAKADWHWRPDEPGDKPRPAPLPFQLSEDGRSARLSLLASAGWFSVGVEDEHGLTNAEEPARHLTIIRDQPPDLQLAGPIGTTRARRDDVITIRTKAADDFGISALELHISRADEQEIVEAALDDELGAKSLQKNFRLDLSRFDLQDGDSLTYRVRTADNRPVPGPQEVWSDERRLIIDPEADLPGSEQILERQNDLRGLLDAILEDLRSNRKRTRELENEADEAFAAGKRFGKAAELTKLEQKQTELSDRLEELAARFGGHRLFANLTPETQRIAREPISEAAKELQNAQIQNDVNDQADSLQKAGASLEKAEKDLEKVSQRFDELAALERDLLVVPRLAQQAQRVADQAVELAERKDNPPADETPAEKAAREIRLQNEEAALEQERQALTRQLDDLLERRPEVLDAARKNALEQIAELAKQAGRLAERQDALTESLEADAAEAANSAAPLIDEAEALLKKAEERQQPNPPAQLPKQVDPLDPLDPERLKNVLDELKAGNLDQAEKAQAQLADRLENLAGELRKNETLSNDPKKAAAQLADRQRELQKELNEALQNAPDANSADREAHQNELQRLAEKQTAIQAGIAELEVPAESRANQQQAQQAAAQAVENLLKGDPKAAVLQAKSVGDALETLAKELKPLDERKLAAKGAVSELRTAQRDLSRDVEQATKDQNADVGRLANRQKELAERLAKLDAPQAEDAWQDAVRKSLRAQVDLEKNRVQDAETSQKQAEQALADLAKTLAGEPTAKEHVESLQKRQEEIRDKVREATENQDQQAIADHAAKQQQQSERLNQLDTPAAEPEKRNAQAAAKQAADALRDPGKVQNADEAVAKAADALKQLQHALSRTTKPAEQAAELSKRQKQAARASQAAAENASGHQNIPSKDERVQQNAELAQLKEDTQRLPAGKDAAAEKAEALEALQKAADAQEELEELIKKQEAKPENSNVAPEDLKADEELQRLMQENALAQKEAAEALQRLEQELAKEENQETLHNELNELDQLAQELLQQREPPKQPSSSPEAEEIEQLAQEARDLQKEIEELKQEKAARQPEQVAQTEQKRTENPEKSRQTEKSNPSETNPLQANPQDPNNSDPNAPSRNSSDPNDSPMNSSDPNRSDPNDPRAEQSPAPTENGAQQPSPAAGASRAGQPGSETNKNAGRARKTGASASQNPSEANRQRGNPQRAEETKPSLAERQRELAQKSAELALEIAREQGADSQSAQKAAQAARDAAKAGQQAGDGALKRAAETAREAGKNAAATGEVLGKQAKESNRQDLAKLSEQAQNQAAAQEALAQEIEAAANDPVKRQAARRSGQQGLAEATERLADDFQDAVDKLTSRPLDLEKPGEKTQSAQRSASQASNEMKSADANVQKGNAARAATAGADASQALRQAAGDSPAPPADTPENTLVPGDLAEQVADARRRLEEARKQLANAQAQEQQASTNPADQNFDDTTSQKPMTGQDGMGQSTPMPNASTGQNPMTGSNPGQGQNANSGQSGTPPNGQGQSTGQPSSLAQSAQSLQKAATALSQAAQQIQGGVPGNSNGNPSSQASNNPGTPGQPSSSGGEGPGSQAPIPIEELEAELQRQNREEWGQLSGQLRTEILQGTQKKPGGHYARLIKLYSEELLKKQQEK